MTPVVFHIDLDAFFASVEQRDRPELAGKPVIVGSPPERRGVVCAASYPARKFGVRSAMPSSTARRLCPKGIFIPPRMEAYRAESRAIMAIVREFTPVIEQVSIDEAYLQIEEEIRGDVDEALYKSVAVARALQNRIAAERRLTASIGIAANKMLAKLGSDFQKPRGLTLIPERDKVAFLRPFPTRAIHGVGPVTERELAVAGIRTIADLQDYRGDLEPLVGSFGPTLKNFAFGIDRRPVDTEDTVKSVGSENTFQRDTDDRDVLKRCLREQAADIAESLRRRGLLAHTIQVKVRYGDFTTLTRQVTFEDPVGEAREIYRAACYVLARERVVTRPLRLIGVSVSSLTGGAGRQMIFPFDRVFGRRSLQRGA